jgi:Tfp pilus assembly protein PilF
MAKYNDALDYYRKAISLNPKNKYARLQFINLLCNTKNYAEAFGESSMMSETDSSAVVLHLQAQSLEGMQQILPAIGCYEVIQDIRTIIWLRPNSET